MKLDELVAIDVHTHAEVSTRVLPDEGARELDEAKGRYFKYVPQHPTIPQMAAYYRERKMAFVVFAVDHEKGLGLKRISNEEVAEAAAEHADVAIPFASIDPGRGKMGVREARRLIEDFGSRASSSTRSSRSSSRTTMSPIRSTRSSRRRNCPRSSTPARPASARACGRAAACG